MKTIVQKKNPLDIPMTTDFSSRHSLHFNICIVGLFDRVTVRPRCRYHWIILIWLTSAEGVGVSADVTPEPNLHYNKRNFCIVK